MVIGAGIGGLVAAALLARRGRRVIVLEQHTVAGGAATVFRRGPWEFDVGLHYVGGCHPGGALPRILEAAGAGDIVFEALDPDGYDRLLFPDFEFRVPVGQERFRERLLQAFPSERRGIDRYLKFSRALRAALAAYHDRLRLAAAVLGSPLLLRHARSTLADFLAGCTRDPRLAAVLSAQHLGYALPPGRASLLVGAGIALHYLDGAFYPRGGGQVLSDRLAASIVRHGGELRLDTTVTRLVTSAGRVTGVQGRGPTGAPFELRAGTVVCNADLRRSFTELLPEAQRSRRARAVAALARQGEPAPALGVLYLGLARDLAAEGCPRANVWLHPELDCTPAYTEAAAGRFHPAPPAFVTIATLKDPGHAPLAPPGHANVQLMTVVPSQPEAWGVTSAQQADGSYRRVPAYRAAKAAFRERMVASAERIWPGASAQVAFAEVATPLTHVRYTRSATGSSYGLAATPRQMLLGRAPAASGVPGLLLCGASGRAAHGIWGAALSGVFAAAELLPPGLRRDVLG